MLKSLIILLKFPINEILTQLMNFVSPQLSRFVTATSVSSSLTSPRGIGTPLRSTSRMIWRPTLTTIRRTAPLITGPFEHADSVVNRPVHRAVIHLDPPLVQPIRMSCSSLLRLTLVVAVIFVSIGGAEQSLQTSDLRATVSSNEY